MNHDQDEFWDAQVQIQSLVNSFSPIALECWAQHLWNLILDCNLPKQREILLGYWNHCKKTYGAKTGLPEEDIYTTLYWKSASGGFIRKPSILAN